MKQIIQDLKSGKTILEEVPTPLVRTGTVLIKTTHSLVSLGTERMLVEFGKANLIDKARQQPDKVKMVLDKIKSDGLIPTLESVFNKLNQPLPLGYCNVGVVIETGKGVSEFKVGDRVVSNGHHAEYVCIAKNLVAKIPEEVTNEEAAFAVIGSIALQGIRLLNPTFGETVVVIGLGLIGQLTAQLLKANGTHVIGFDFDKQKIALAANKGIEAIDLSSEGINPVNYCAERTNGIGVDGVIITASDKSNDIISNAAKMCRKKGRIILVGVIGLNISRADFYEKELTFQVSCSYGPGRYDEAYEGQGNDYPLPFVRWTENRNFQTILWSIANEKLDVKSLITEVVPLHEYDKIYGSISNSKSIASILKYPDASTPVNKIHVENFHSFAKTEGIGIIGAGNFTNGVILPSLSKTSAKIKYIASQSGVSAKALSKKYKIDFATSDYKQMLQDDEVGLVLITTRHNLHPAMCIECLEAGKNVFVEKPLAITLEQLEKVIHSKQQTGNAVVVGFNRRFSPHAIKAKQLLGNSQNAINIIATMNAGFIPASSWVHDLEIGGGRIIGEACHLLDLMVYLTSSKIQFVCANSLGINAGDNTDNASILVRFENGSQGVLNYFSNGSKKYSKERFEIYSQEKTIVIDNFRETKGYGFKSFSKLKTSQDKGHKQQFHLLSQFSQKGGEPIIPFDEIVNVTKASILCIQSLKEGKWLSVE